ncbi:S8 family serine peptidase, partial [Patescibacteria group bacterium]
ISQKEPKEKYAKGEMIVVLDKTTKFKLKDKSITGKTFEKGSVDIADLDESSLPNSVKKFAEEYGLLKIDKLAGKYDTPEEFLDNFKTKHKDKLEKGRKKIDEASALEKDITNIYLLSFDAGKDVKTAIKSIKEKEGVLDASPNYVMQAHQYIPNDTYFESQWALNNTGQGGGSVDSDIDAPEAWEISTGSSDVIIGIVDSGVDYTHPDLGGCIGEGCKVVGGYDFLYRDQDPDPMDDLGHGTHVAGIAAGIANNALGISGVCPECKILALQFLNESGFGYFFDSLLAIEYGVDNGVDVINMSYGCSEPECTYWQWEDDFYAWANSYGVTLVASAGNTGEELRSYPAACNNVISVAATNYSDRKAYYSSYGDWVDVSAPGGERLNETKCIDQSILSLGTDGGIWDDYNWMYPMCELTDDAGNKYIALQGTSMASPHVAGVLGLLLSENMDLTPEELKLFIKANTDDIYRYFNQEYIGKIGTGRINAYKTITRGEMCEFERSWGSYGTEDGQFINPVGVFLGSDIFVVDSERNDVQKFRWTGSFSSKWGLYGTGDGEFDEPRGIIGDGGWIYIADTNNNRIQKFANNGVYVAKWGSFGSENGEFNKPWGVATSRDPTPSNFIYVADTYNHRIQKFDSSGNFISKWGSPGTGDGQFNLPKGIGVDKKGFIYVVDSGNNRIQKFDANGSFITKWGSLGSEEGQFDSPVGLYVTGADEGVVYVADTENNRIQVFTPDGDYITSWGSQGLGDMEFSSPNGMSGEVPVVVVDTQNQKVKSYFCNIPRIPGSYIGDANYDEIVDEQDYAIFLSNYKKTGSGLGGDFNKDNRVDGVDYAIWVTTYSPVATNTPTPLPTSTPTPTHQPSCSVSLLPSTYSLRSRQSVGLTAYVSISGGASVGRVEFISSNSGLVTVSPTSDYSYPYQTNASTKNIKSTDSVTITIKVYLNESANICSDTSTIIVSK